MTIDIIVIIMIIISIIIIIMIINKLTVNISNITFIHWCIIIGVNNNIYICLLYTSDAADDSTRVDLDWSFNLSYVTSSNEL